MTYHKDYQFHKRFISEPEEAKEAFQGDTAQPIYAPAT